MKKSEMNKKDDPLLYMTMNGIGLHLTNFHNRKGLAFCFSEGNTFHPVAYVSQKNKERTIELWNKFLGDANLEIPL